MSGLRAGLTFVFLSAATAAFGQQGTAEIGGKITVVQLDLRAGYKIRLGGQRTLDAFVDVFNVTNRANFANPASGNRRVQADFLRLNALVGGTGFPRQAQFGLRLGF